MKGEQGGLEPSISAGAFFTLEIALVLVCQDARGLLKGVFKSVLCPSSHYYSSSNP